MDPLLATSDSGASPTRVTHVPGRHPTEDTYSDSNGGLGKTGDDDEEGDDGNE